jgi:NAD(P)-dependent dehydrogenase (short-subunit alcohol dehydrogenase family)
MKHEIVSIIFYTSCISGLLKKSAPSRIVTVSSLLHKYAKFDLDNLNCEKWFNDIQVYNCSKLANILTTNELSRKLDGTGILHYHQCVRLGCQTHVSLY